MQDAWVSKVDNRLDRLESDMRNIETRMAVSENEIKTIKEDIKTIKSNTTWILRLIVGSIVLAIIGFLLKDGGSIV